MAIVQAMTRNATQFGTCGVRKLDFCWKHRIHRTDRLCASHRDSEPPSAPHRDLRTEHGL